jgi:hypothetical protein
MSGLSRDNGRHLSARDEDGARALCGMVAALALSVVLWLCIGILLGGLL